MANDDGFAGIPELRQGFAGAAPVAHRCSGCNHRWQDLPGVELCGDCWRKVQPKLDWMENTTGRAVPRPDESSWTEEYLRAAPVEAPQPRQEAQRLDESFHALMTYKPEPEDWTVGDDGPEFMDAVALDAIMDAIRAQR